MVEKGKCAGGARILVLGLTASAGVLISPAAWAATTTNSGQAYVDECRAAGVPVPPPFNYEDAWHERPNSKWTNNGILDITIAGSSDQIAEVFYYDSREDPTDPTNPPGLCIALPRSVFPAGQTPADGPPTHISLLGVICQGATTGKACFWDNGRGWLRAAGFDLEGVDPFWTLEFGDGPRNTRFVGGAELGQGLGGNCAGCHQGENVFIVHPDTPLDIADRMPDLWHEPIVPDVSVLPPLEEIWPENPGPFGFDTARNDSCLVCHNTSAEPALFAGRFPQVSNENRTFCTDILENVVGLTMPPSGPPLDTLRAACNEPPPPEMSPAQKMMSFEGGAEQFWLTELGTVSDVTGNVTQGNTAMSVNASGYVRIDSATFDTWQLPFVGTRLDLDVYVPPAGQPNQYWLGAVQLFMTIPSAQITNSYVGQIELTPGGTGWRTGSFQLPSQVHTAMLQRHADVRFGIAVNTPQGAPPLVLDNLRFEGTLSMPPSPPNLTTQYNFERGGAWEGRDGAVVDANNAGDQSFLGFSSLRVELDGASAGRVWTAPANSPAPGTTISYRVYVPSGTPVSAVQPYISDANFTWSHSWNPNLPRNAWMTLTVVVPPGVALPLKEIGVKFYLSAPHTGAVYVDAVQW
jgi:hypothetical protein